MADINKNFLGVGWSFPPEFSKQTNAFGVKMVAGEEDIAESVRILLSTVPGERTMQPNYGCGLHAMVFETINESTITELKDIIERSILFFEPRITLESIDIDTGESLEGSLKIRLNYTVRHTNTRSNIVYPFYYLEGSQVNV